MTLFPSLLAEPPQDDVSLLLHEIEAATDRKAAQVALMLIVGWPVREIREQLGLRDPEYKQLIDQLRRCLDAERCR